MIITVAAYKGGVGKTTTAVHLAAYLQRKAPTLLIDGDANRSAVAWSRNGHLPFKVVAERQAARLAREYEHVVIDTEAGVDQDDLSDLVAGGDRLVIPSTPDALSLDALMQTVSALRKLGAEHYQVLLTIVPPAPSRDGEDARAHLLEQGIPLFTAAIPRLVVFSKAALAGQVVSNFNDERAQRAWGAYEAVGKEILS